MFVNRNGEPRVGLIILTVIVGLLTIIGIGMRVMPQYRVWSQEMRGRAELARAEHSKQILMIEAQAMLEAERLNAQAEVVRAKGMAEAIAIEGGYLTELYIQYLWVRAMAGNPNVIYIPTEAGLPILERRR